ERVDAALAAHPWARRLVEASLPGPRPGAPELPHPFQRRLSKIHLLRLILGDDRRTPERKVVDLAASGWNLVINRSRLPCRPAPLITARGPDGAGKSRLAEALASSLRLCEVPTRRLWSRGGFSAIVVSGKSLARAIAPRALPSASDEGGKRAFLSRGWRRTIW